MEPLEQQLEKAYEEYADAMYRFCLYKTSNAALAEDLVQEVFMRFWNYLVKGGDVESAKSLLYKIARNLVVDHYRKKTTQSLEVLQEVGFEPSGDDHVQIVAAAEKNIALTYIAQLDEKYREVVYLRLVEEMNMKEIAQALGISANNATVRFHRGLKQVELTIKKYEKE